MKIFVALFFVIAVTQGKPSGFVVPVAPVLSAEISTQYLAQDSAGQYTYGYSNPLSSKAEVRSLDGVTQGAYNYLDGAGKFQTVSYKADGASGFQLVSATNLPQAPAVPQVPELIPPKPVEDTPEVVEARAKHLDAVKEAEVSATAEPAVVVTKTETTIPGAASVKLATPALAAVSPLVSYNYGIPGATVTYSTYSAPLLTAYNTVVAAPVFHPFLPVPALPALPALPGLPAAPAEEQKVDVQNDSVTVEAKESKE